MAKSDKVSTKQNPEGVENKELFGVEQLELPSFGQLEVEALIALRTEMTAPSTPSAARVAAAKAVLERIEKPNKNLPNAGERDPGELTLEEINSRLGVAAKKA